MSNVQWIEQNGKRILYLDYTGATPEQMLENLENGIQMVAGITEGLLLLADFQGAMIDMTFMQHLKIAGKEVFEPITGKEAVVGVQGLRHILLHAYNTFTGARHHQQIFDNTEEALEWLIS